MMPRALAKRYCEIFADADAIVSPSGSCTAMCGISYPNFSQSNQSDDSTPMSLPSFS